MIWVDARAIATGVMELKSWFRKRSIMPEPAEPVGEPVLSVKVELSISGRIDIAVPNPATVLVWIEPAVERVRALLMMSGEPTAALCLGNAPATAGARDDGFVQRNT